MNYKQLANELKDVLAGKKDDAFIELFKHVHCMSAPRVYAVINACVNAMEAGETYLEVGTYQGGSLIAALLGNQAEAIGVDNFAEFKDSNRYEKTLGNLETFGVKDRVDFHNMGFNQFFAQRPSGWKVQVYYYDGEHNYQGQLAGLEAGWPFVQAGSLIIVDDYIYPEVVQAVHQFVANHKEDLVFQFVMLPMSGTDPLWWNGVVVLRVL